MTERAWFMMALLTVLLYVGAKFGLEIARTAPRLLSIDGSHSQIVPVSRKS